MGPSKIWVKIRSIILHSQLLIQTCSTNNFGEYDKEKHRLQDRVYSNVYISGFVVSPLSHYAAQFLKKEEIKIISHNPPVKPADALACTNNTYIHRFVSLLSGHI